MRLLVEKKNNIMSNFNWKALQNGSDIRGVALEGVSGENVNLTPDTVARLGEAFVAWLQKRSNKTKLRLAVGMDSRLSGPDLRAALCRQLSRCGAEVLDCGLASTPAMFMTTIGTEEPADGALMLTASHLPFNRNGIKFFTPEGGLEKKDISDLLALAEEGPELPTSKAGSIKEVDFMSTYAAHFVELIREGVKHPTHYNEPLKGIKIVVDAGNGAGGFYASKVLAPLGADVSASQFLEPDGRFPNHVPNPEDELAMASVVRQVKNNGADLGIIFDTDVDRAALVAENGQAINRNELIALISAVVLDEHPGSTVVTDSVTSNGLSWFINQHLKGRHHRYQRGYKNVINEAKRLNDKGEECWLAIETSGHAALRENHFLDDGAFLATKLVISMARARQQGKKLTDLLTHLPQPLQSCEVRLTIKTSDFKDYGEKIITDLGILAGNRHGWDIAPDNYEGVRIQCGPPLKKGWFLLRMSLHDPVLPLNLEAEEAGALDEMLSLLRTFFSVYEHLDSSAIDHVNC